MVDPPEWMQEFWRQLEKLPPRPGMFYDRDGNEITMADYERLLYEHGEEYRRVDWDQVGDVVVSTVWTGMNQGLPGYGPPLMFETMVFDPQPNQRWKWSTDESAMLGHATVVDAVRRGLDLDELEF